MKSKLLFDVPQYKKLRVIIDTDAACEADDPFAIAQALMSPKLMVKGILAEHFAAEGSVQRSYDEVCTILDAMDMKEVPVFMGEPGAMAAGYFEKSVSEESVSPAAEFLIKADIFLKIWSPIIILLQPVGQKVKAGLLVIRLRLALH